MKLTTREIQERAIAAAIKVYLREVRKMKKRMRELFDDDDPDDDEDQDQED